MSSVSEKFASFIKDTFFVEPVHILQQINEDKWTYKKRSITYDQIENHFNGDYYIGYVCQHTPVSFLVFDLDRHKGESLTDLINRVDLINDILGRPNIIGASPGNGFHNYYFLNKSYTLAQIKNTIQELVNLKQSKIELFPAGRGLRLFGGKNCPLISNTTFKTVASTPSEIEEYFSQAWERSEKLRFDEFVNKTIPKIIQGPYKFKIEIKNLLDNGVPEEGTRHRSLLKINWVAQTHWGFTPEKAEEFMIDWISTKSNNKSKDWSNNPQGVLKEIKNMAERYDSTKVTKVKRFALEKLSFEIIIAIRDIADNISDSTELEASKLEEFMQCLFSYCIENHSNCVVEIPSSVFKACKYGSRARYIKYKSELINHGVITLVKNYSTASNKCATYKIRSDLLK